MRHKEKNFVTAIVYVHNEEKNIEEFMSYLAEVLETHFESSEIICVNDSSTDKSVERIHSACERIKGVSVSVVSMSYYQGVELAMNAGVDLSIGDFVFEFENCCRDYDAEDIMNVYYKALEGNDIVCASTDKKQKLSSSAFYYVFHKLTGNSYRMQTDSFCILSRRVINRIESMNKTVPYRKAVYANCGLKIASVCYRAKGNINKKRDSKERNYRKELAIETLVLFTGVGYRFAVLMTTVMMLVTILVAIYALNIYLLQTPIAGWTTTILFLAFAFFCLFGILTIIIKYLAILVDLVFKKQKYSIEGIEKITK